MPDPFDLNLRHLRAIPQIVARGSLVAAAETANLSQSALTQGLAKLERQLGVVLFDRRNDGMIATREGAAFSERLTTMFHYLGEGVPPAPRSARGFSRPDRLLTSAQLRSFVKLADAGSYVEAARQNEGAPSAIHRAVHDLEQIVGARLVERRGRGLGLTSAGKRLARGIRLARAELEAAIEGVSPGAGERGRLVIGAMPLCRSWLLPAALATLISEVPRAQIDIVEGSWRELIDPLRDGQIHLMIGALREDPVPYGLLQQTLFVDRLSIVGRAGHPALKAGTGLAELAQYPWIIGRDRTPLRAHWQMMFSGFPEIRAPIACGSVMTIRGILLASDCLTLLSPDQVATEIEAGLLEHRDAIGERLTRPIGIASRPAWRPTDLQKRFLEILHSVAANHHS
ncbi:LysR family transcriptional regulator [Sphingopyxis flava]|uniref:Transcriptional regulator n=1 Tax=Sphingopyxis flava TaxID=1507287 RepID=A0A1T5DWA8_9SPHN|nr:LysR family transcriptional regulator [Sphingopyxis flava]SKB76052.1 transcriptional regulator [Sphingopyxis flava]